jgi:hypothetical protein
VNDTHLAIAFLVNTIRADTNISTRYWNDYIIVIGGYFGFDAAAADADSGRSRFLRVWVYYSFNKRNIKHIIILFKPIFLIISYSSEYFRLLF